jgi:hypothetical protein
MNQYTLIARSFVTDSKIIRGGACLGVVLSIVCAVLGVFHLSLIIAFMICMGIGQANFNFRRWDTSLFIPEMNKKMALTAVGATVLAWLVVATLIIATNGFSLLWLGMALVSVTGGLWFGSGDRMAQYVYLPISMMFIIFLMGTVLVATRDLGQQEQITKWISSFVFDRLSSMERIIGVMAGWLGVAILFRFWFYSTSRQIDRGLQCTEIDLNEPSTPIKLAGEQKNSSKERNLATGDVGNKSNVAGSSRFARINRLVAQTSFSTTTETRFVALFFLLATVLMLLSRGNEQAMMAMLWFSALFLVGFPASVLFGDVKTYFERLWIIGAGIDRASTSRKLIQIEAKRSLIACAWVIAALFLMFPWEPIQLAAGIVVELGAFGLAGLMLWFVSTRYQFWANISDAMIIMVIFLFLVFGAIAMGLAVHFDLNFARLKGLVSAIGVVPSLLTAAIASALSWWLAMQEASKNLARQTRLTE